LVRSNQVERDLAVDFAAGATPCDLEVVGIDLTHKKLFRMKTY